MPCQTNEGASESDVFAIATVQDHRSGGRANRGVCLYVKDCTGLNVSPVTLDVLAASRSHVTIHKGRRAGQGTAGLGDTEDLAGGTGDTVGVTRITERQGHGILCHWRESKKRASPASAASRQPSTEPATLVKRAAPSLCRATSDGGRRPACDAQISRGDYISAR